MLQINDLHGVLRNLQAINQGDISTDIVNRSLTLNVYEPLVAASSSLDDITTQQESIPFQ